MGDGSFGHDAFLQLSSLVSAVSARISPSRSGLRSQASRLSLIQRSAALSAFGSIRQVRTRPSLSVLTRPLASRTLRCWTTADSDIVSGSASWLTEAGPRDRRSTICRRAGSASAWNIRSSWAGSCSMVALAVVVGEELEIGLRFLDHAGEGRALEQTIVVAFHSRKPIAERFDLVGVEQRRRGRAVGHAEGLADRPGLPLHPPFDDGVGIAQLLARLLDPKRIGLVLWPQPVADDLLHRLLHVEVVEAVGLSDLDGEVDVGGDKLDRSGVIGGQIFDDDGRFHHSPVPRIVTQSRHLARRRNLQKGRARLLLAEIDDHRPEGRVVLVERDQRLPAEGSERM